MNQDNDELINHKEIPSGPISKSDILNLYPKLSASTLRTLLNNVHYEALKAHGYKRNSKILSPNQFQLFIDLYGRP